LNQFWDSNELDLLEYYYSTRTKHELLKLFPKRTYQAIQRMASTLGVKRNRIDFHHTSEARSRMSKAHTGIKLSSEHKGHMRRCTLNESAFDTLTESSHYWIGFMITDGNVCYKKGVPIIALHLKAEDLPHLLKFREFVGSSHKVGSYVNKTWENTSCSLSFSSEKMANALGKYGFVPKKCFIAEIKGGVESNRHLWRGVIDGDGSLGVYVRKNSNGGVLRVPYITVTGTKNVCLQFKSFLEKELGELMPPSVVFYKKSYLLMVSGHRAVKGIKLLYNDCTIALERKLIKAREIIEEFRKASLLHSFN
jgi:hypothetical protein